VFGGKDVQLGSVKKTTASAEECAKQAKLQIQRQNFLDTAPAPRLYRFVILQDTHTHTHTHRFNGHLPGEPGLAGCPLNVPFSFSLRLQDRPRACCRNVRLANRRLTLTARLTRCRVGRSSVSLAISLTVCPVLTNLLTLKHSA